jgi:hypothetical protein
MNNAHRAAEMRADWRLTSLPMAAADLDDLRACTLTGQSAPARACRCERVWLGCPANVRSRFR